MPTDSFDIWWLLVASGLGALILVVAVVLATIVQQRRYLAATRMFSGQLMVAHEEERAYLARELHDGLVQRVVLLGNELTHFPVEAANIGGSDGPDLGRWRNGLREELVDLAEEIRRIAHRMHPSVLDLMGLGAALESLVDEVGSNDGLHVRLHQDPLPPDLKPGTALCLYRVAQEGIRNIVRHAHTSDATLRIRKASNAVVMELSDSGSGFDQGQCATSGGMGMRSIEERVRLAGGKSRIRSAPGSGTTVTVSIPL